MPPAHLFPAFSTVLLAAFATAASAETIEIRTGQQSTPPASAEQIRVSVGVNVFVSSVSEDGDQALKAQETGRKTVYDIAGHECAVLRDVLASDCRLEAINVNIQSAAPRRLQLQRQYQLSHRAEVNGCECGAANCWRRTSINLA